MKIEDALNGVRAVRSRDTRKGKPGAVSAPAAPSHATDSVEITPASAQLSRLGEELALVDNAETGKVEAVRQAIAEGRFQVDEEVVAEALVQNTIEQLRRQGGK